MDVVGTDVGQPEDHDVALALHVHDLLAVEVGDGGGVHGFDFARLHARHLMGPEDRLEYRPAGGRAEHGEAPAGGDEAGPVAHVPFPLALLQEGHL